MSRGGTLTIGQGWWCYPSTPGYMAVMPVSTLPVWEQQLNTFATIGDNWNSYGAPAPSAWAIEKAKRYSEELDRVFVPPNRVAPSVVGGVGVTVKNEKGRKVYVEIHNDARIYALFSEGPDKEPTVTPYDGNDLEAIARNTSAWLAL